MRSLRLLERILAVIGTLLSLIITAFGVLKSAGDTGNSAWRPVAAKVLPPVAKWVAPKGYEVAPKDLEVIPRDTLFSCAIGGTALLTETHQIPFAVAEPFTGGVYIRVDGQRTYLHVGEKHRLKQGDSSLWLYSIEPGQKSYSFHLRTEKSGAPE